MSTIPELREELRVLSHRLGVPRLAEIAAELKRRPAQAAGRVTSTPMTPALRAQIRAYALANPALTQVEVARVFNVNPGRVSEAVSGRRK